MRVTALVAIGGALEERVGNAQHSWQRRDSLLFRVVDDSGRVGLGEAAPLPGYSSDTLEDCRRALASLTLPQEELSLTRIRQLVATLPAELPAARFALECSLLDLLAQERATSVAELLASDGATERCALLDADDALASAQALLARGVHTAKLKVGRSWTQELQTITMLRARCPELALRLDANGAWSVTEAKDHLHALAGLDIEFVEQPVPPAEMAALRASPVPLAADESMRCAAHRDALAPLISDKSLVAVVLKPTVLGGLFPCMELASWAGDRGLHSIASHCFEGPVGTAAVAELAVATRGALAAGVDCHPGLSAYPIAELAQLSGPALVSHRPGLGVRWPA